MTDSEYVLSLIDETFASVPEVKAHHERMRSIAAKLALLDAAMPSPLNGLTEAETSAAASVAGLTVKPWTKWDGGRCPVSHFHTVEVRFDDGNTVIDRAGAFFWNWENDRSLGGDIVAYRVL